MSPPVVERESIEITLAREIKGLPPADQALCRALLKAIRHVQRPEWVGGYLPEYLVRAVEKWAKGQDAKWRRGSDLIRRTVEFHEQYHGLKRTRSTSTTKKKAGSPTAYSVAAQELQIPEATVVNRVGRKRVTKSGPGR